MLGRIKIALRNQFVTGILVLAPIGLTFWLIRFLLTVTDGLLKIQEGKFFYFIPSQYHPNHLLGMKIPFLGLLLVLSVLLVVGFFARNFIGKRIIQWAEDILHRIPIIRSVYNSSKQLLTTILAQDSKNFREVILVEYPRKGLYTIGFISGRSFEKVQRHSEKNLVSIFVPTTPNPTSGFFMMAPEDDLIKLDMTPEDAFKLIISFGIVTPPEHASAAGEKPRRP